MSHSLYLSSHSENCIVYKLVCLILSHKSLRHSSLFFILFPLLTSFKNAFILLLLVQVYYLTTLVSFQSSYYIFQHQNFCFLKIFFLPLCWYSNFFHVFFFHEVIEHLDDSYFEYFFKWFIYSFSLELISGNFFDRAMFSSFFIWLVTLCWMLCLWKQTNKQISLNSYGLALYKERSLLASQ